MQEINDMRESCALLTEQTLISCENSGTDFCFLAFPNHNMLEDLWHPQEVEHHVNWTCYYQRLSHFRPVCWHHRSHLHAAKSCGSSLCCMLPLPLWLVLQWENFHGWLCHWSWKANVIDWMKWGDFHLMHGNKNELVLHVTLWLLGIGNL